MFETFQQFGFEYTKQLWKYKGIIISQQKWFW